MLPDPEIYERARRTGKPARRKPAWSLQEREMVDHLGLRRSGSSPLRTFRQLAMVPLRDVDVAT
jgi:hypothetical protein